MIFVKSLLRVIAFYDLFWKTLYQLIPSHIKLIEEIDPTDRTVTRIHGCSSMRALVFGDNWQNSLISIDPDQFYNIQCWNGTDSLAALIKGSRLLAAMNGSQPWVYSSRGLFEKISGYLASPGPDPIYINDILSIKVNGQYEPTILAPYIKSLGMSKNATATAACLLVEAINDAQDEDIMRAAYDIGQQTDPRHPRTFRKTFKTNKTNKKNDDDTVVLTDFTLTEKTILNNDELFSE